MEDFLKNILQTNQLDYDTLVLVGNAAKEEMNKREKEKIVKERFGEITEHTKKKNNKIVPYFMAYDGRRQITASTKEALMEKLCSMVVAEDIKDVTVAELFEIYYDERRNDRSISDRTSDYDRVNWNRFFKDTDFSHKKVAGLTSVDILREYKRVAGRGEVTKKVFNKAACLLNGMFDTAVEQGIVEVNVARNTPTRKLVFKPEADNSDMVYKPKERDQLIEYVKTLPQTRYTLAIRLMACLPLRIGELRALTWEDYDEKEKKLHIRHEIVKVNKDGKNKCDADVPYTKGAKNSGIRKIKVSLECQTVLEELRAINGDKKYILHGQGKATYAILENRIRDRLKEYCDAAGVPYFSPHKFRFYGASQMYRAGVPLNTIRYYLGHSTIQMTEHYLRLVPDEVDDDIIEAVFG